VDKNKILFTRIANKTSITSKLYH